MADKVYVVEGSTGCYDDFYPLVIGIYTSRTEAEKVMAEVQYHSDKQENKYTTEEKFLLEEEYMECPYVSGDPEMPAHLAEYRRWEMRTRLNPEIEIVEHELNTLLIDL